MIVKIGDTYYDSDEQPILLILSKGDKNYISKMGEQTRYCSFPLDSIINNIQEFMKVPQEMIDKIVESSYK